MARLRCVVGGVAMNGTISRIRAGDLQHRIRLQSRTSTQDAHGNNVDTWSTDATAWADIQPIGGNESLLGPRVNASSTHFIVIRGRFVSPYGRVKFKNRVFDINRAANISERSVVTVLECTETAALTDSDGTPDAPTNLTATAGLGTAVSLSWTDNSDNETNFVLQRSTDNATWTDVSEPAADATSASVTGLIGNTTYYFRLAAQNEFGLSSYATTSKLTPLCGDWVVASNGNQPGTLSFLVSGYAVYVTVNIVDANATNWGSSLDTVGSGWTMSVIYAGEQTDMAWVQTVTAGNIRIFTNNKAPVYTAPAVGSQLSFMWSAP